MSKRIELKAVKDVLQKLTNLEEAISEGVTVGMYLESVEFKVEFIPFAEVLQELTDPGKAYSEGVLVTPHSETIIFDNSADVIKFAEFIRKYKV